jgi:ABC-type transport system involved in multi-copper enzyme maturation permease subunit
MFWLETKFLAKQKWTILGGYLVMSVVYCLFYWYCVQKIAMSPVMGSNILFLYLSTLYTLLFSNTGLSDFRSEGSLQTLLSTRLTPLVIFIGRFIRMLGVSIGAYISMFAGFQCMNCVFVFWGGMNPISTDELYISIYCIIILVGCISWYLSIAVLISLLFQRSANFQLTATYLSFVFIIVCSSLLWRLFSYTHLAAFSLVNTVMCCIGIFFTTVAAKYIFRLESVRWESVRW